MKPTIKQLRKEHPSWSWTYERFGFGIVYIGTRGDRRVELGARAQICDDEDSPLPPIWYAYEGDISNGAMYDRAEPFFAWAEKQQEAR